MPIEKRIQSSHRLRRPYREGLELRLEWHNRPLHFGEMAGVAGLGWARRAAAAFSATSSQKENINDESKRVAAFEKFVKFIGGQRDREPLGPSAKALRDMRSKKPKLDWATYQAAANEFSSHLADLDSDRIVASKNIKTRNGIMNAVVNVARRLAGRGVMPDDLKFKFLSGEKAYGVTTPTLADLAHVRDKHASSEHTKGATRESTFAREHAHFIRQNQLLLSALNECASTDLLSAFANLQAGQRILEQHKQDDPDKLFSLLRQLDNNMRDGGSIPESSKITELLVRYYGKVPPKRGRPLFGHLTRHVGWDEVISHLQPTPIALISALILFQTSSGWPLAQGLSLPAEPFVSEARNGKQRVANVSAIKRRARGNRIEIALQDKAIHADLSTKNRGRSISAIRAIKIWQSMTSALRGGASANSAEALKYLWAMRVLYSPIRLPDAVRIAGFMRTFLKRHKEDPLIGGLKITFRVIRRTVQVTRKYRTPEDLLRAQLDAGHKDPAMTLAYLGVNSLRRLLEKEIRKFQRKMEVAFSSGIKRAALHLGIPERQFRYLKKLAKEELGDEFFISTYDSMPEREAKKAKETAAVKLSLRRFVASPEALEALYLTHLALQRSMEGFTAGNIQRWVKVWMPYYALVVALIKKIQQSAYAAKYAAAGRTADDRLARGLVTLPAVW